MKVGIDNGKGLKKEMTFVVIIWTWEGGLKKMIYFECVQNQMRRLEQFQYLFKF